MCYTIVTVKDRSPKRKDLILMPIVTSITKEGSEFVLHMSDRPKPIRINVVTGDVISYTGRSVQRFPSIVEFEKNALFSSWGYQNLIEGLTHFKNKSDYYRNQVLRLEKFLSCLERYDGYIDECPKGYLNWIVENDLMLNERTLSEFKWYKKTKNFSEEDKNFANAAREFCGWWLTKLEYTEWKMLIRLYKTQMKDIKKQLSLGRDMCSFLHIYGGLPQNERIHIVKNVIDTNRDFSYNKELIENWQNAERNAKIIQQEDRIREITTLENEELCVIVPQTIEDFTEEGRQQNNCVGHYYHDSIADGENLIYFIRYKSNPNKSYITCRFRIKSDATIEARIVNNRSVHDDNAKQYMNEIDEMIRKLIGNN